MNILPRKQPIGHIETVMIVSEDTQTIILFTYLQHLQNLVHKWVLGNFVQPWRLFGHQEAKDCQGLQLVLALQVLYQPLKYLLKRQQSYSVGPHGTKL